MSGKTGRVSLLWIMLVLMSSGCTSKSSSGTKPVIHIKGSDTMLPIAQALANAYDGANIEVSGGGSRIGLEDLINKKVNIANASRPASAVEIQKAYEEREKVLKPFIVGYDAIAIYVHESNPLEEISFEQLAGIFGKEAALTDWSQLGVKILNCEDNTILPVRRDTDSGTSEFFRRKILGEKGEFNPDTIETMTSPDLVTLISFLHCAIGFSGTAFKTEAVKVLKLKLPDGVSILPATARVLDENYPLTRPLFMYTLGSPRRHLRAYIEWVQSKPGQEIIEQSGGLSIPLEKAN